MVKRFWLLFILAGFCRISWGQPSQIIPVINDSVRDLFTIEQHDLSFNGNPYRLYIAESKTNSNVPRPILYMLDGNGMFPVLLNGITEISDNTPLIVGIGYPSDKAFPKERIRDYTPVEYNGEGGGAEIFYRFIDTKVKRFIEDHYAVDATRQTLCGHSHGGLFTLYVASRHTDSFQQYVVASPSIWWTEGETFQDKHPIFESIPCSITITLGEYEENPESDPHYSALSSEIRKTKKSRKSKIPVRMLVSMIAEEIPSCRFTIYKGKNHGSSIPYFLSDALKIAETACMEGEK